MLCGADDGIYSMIRFFRDSYVFSHWMQWVEFAWWNIVCATTNDPLFSRVYTDLLTFYTFKNASIRYKILFSFFFTSLGLTLVFRAAEPYMPCATAMRFYIFSCLYLRAVVWALINLCTQRHSIYIVNRTMGFNFVIFSSLSCFVHFLFYSRWAVVDLQQTGVNLTRFSNVRNDNGGKKVCASNIFGTARLHNLYTIQLGNHHKTILQYIESESPVFMHTHIVWRAVHAAHCESSRNMPFVYIKVEFVLLKRI